MIIADKHNADCCHTGQVERSIEKLRDRIARRLEHKSVAAVQIQCELTVPVSGQRMEAAGQSVSEAEIAGCDQVVETGTELPGGRLSEPAHGERIVMAQLP